MLIRTSCPSCKAVLNLDDSKLGKKVRCKKCEGVFTAQPADEDDSGEAQPRPSRGITGNPPAQSRRSQDEDEDGEGNRRKPVRGRKDEDEDDPTPVRRRPIRDRDEDTDDSRPRRPGRDRDRDEKADSKKGGLWLVLGLGLVGVLFLGCGGLSAVAWFALSPSKTNPISSPNPGPIALANPQNPGKGPQGGPDVKPPEEKKEPKALPATLSGEDLIRVKKATVQLRAELPVGGVSQGTGFFAVDPGIIITNAHVLGMLSADSLPPKNVKVIVNSGVKSDQFEVKGTILGVDRTHDLAVLRADAGGASLPPPLEVDSATRLIETQKVFVLGFPLARQIGQAITVSDTSVTSLREKDGVLRQVQVKGGMNPGNSGGPVIDTRGVVVAVAVSIISGTELSFAIPGDDVRRLLAGGIAEQEYGMPFTAGGQTQIPVRLTSRDPLNRIREVSIEIWSGPAGDPLPAGEKEPAQRLGEGARQRFATKATGMGFTADVLLPPLPAGQVYWAQPVTTNATGGRQWAAARAIPFDPNSVLERKPANLTFKPPAAPTERTLHIRSNRTLTVPNLEEPLTVSLKMDCHALESIGPDGKEPVTRAQLQLHQPRFTREARGEVREAPAILGTLVNRLSPSYLITPDHSVKTFVRPSLNGVPADYQDVVQDLFDTVCNSYEVTTIPLPNRMVTPQDTWTAKVPMLISTGAPQQQRVRVGTRVVIRTIPARKEARSLNLTCTFEGMRVVSGSPLAHVRLSGVVNGVGPKAKEVYGKVTGHALVDLTSGMLSRVSTTISQELEGEDDVRLLVTNENTIDRVPGNTQGIKPPPPITPPPPTVAKGPDGAAKVIPGDIHEFVANAIKDKRVAAVDLSGARGGRMYVEVPPEGALLIGFQVTHGMFGPAKVVYGLRAIYQTKEGEKLGALHGKAPTGPADTVTLKARPGYVVSGANLRAGLSIDGLQLTYRKLVSGRLDEKDTYTSDWAGNTTGGAPSSLGGQGIFFVGITGHVNGGGNTCSLGLITVLSSK
jgi:predicted Zn finger-like uncharacterized protein